MIGHRYKPHAIWSPSPVDQERCVASVSSGGRGASFHQCHRSRWHASEGGEWCRQHDPPRAKKRHEERIQARRDQNDECQRRFDAATVKNGLARATDEQLVAEVRRRGLTITRKARP